MKDRTVMTLCVHVSLFLHWWLFLSLNTYAQVKQLNAEKTGLLKSMSYARRIGIDVSTYQGALKAPPFEPRFENKLEFARLIHSQLHQMLLQLNSEISHGDYSKGAANNDAVLIVVSGDENVISHALLVHPTGRVECRVDTVSNEADNLGADKVGGLLRTFKLDESDTQTLFALLNEPNNLESLPANRPLPDQQQDLTPQMLYVDYKGHTSPNLLCADTPDGQDIASCCQKIERQLKMAQIAHMY